MKTKLSLELARLEDRILRLQEKYQIPEDHEKDGEIWLDDLELARLSVHRKWLDIVIDETMKEKEKRKR